MGGLRQCLRRFLSVKLELNDVISAEKVRSRGQNVAPEIDEDLRKNLLPLEVICYTVLLPNVCAGNAEEVQAVLRSVGSGGGLEECQAAVRTARHESKDLAPDGGADGQNAGTDKELDKTLCRRCANFICPKSGWSLLMLACVGGHEAVVRELLHFGADPSWSFRHVFTYSSNCVEDEEANCTLSLTISCLSAAVCVGGVGSVTELVKAGAQATASVWNMWLFVLNHQSLRTQSEIVMALTNSCEIPTPLVSAYFVLRRMGAGAQRSRLATMYRKPGSISWLLGWQIFCNLSSIIYRPDLYFLLQQPAYSQVGKFCKALIVQALLVQLCTAQFQAGHPEKLLSVLLEQGANIHGWTYWHTVAMLAGFLDLTQMPRNHGAEPSSIGNTELDSSQWLGVVFTTTDKVFDIWTGISPVCLLCRKQGPVQRERSHLSASILKARTASQQSPILQASVPASHLPNTCGIEETSSFCLLPAVLTQTRSSCEEVKQAILKKTRVPWLSNVSRVPSCRTSFPFPDRFLHDGPACSDHAEPTAEQKQVSLTMCTSSGGLVQSLQSLSRDVILTSCLQTSRNVFDAVTGLPLPAVMKDYLLTN